MYTLLFVCSVVLLVYSVIHREYKVQQDFETKIANEWNSMTEQEKLESGREDKYC